MGTTRIILSKDIEIWWMLIPGHLVFWLWDVRWFVLYQKKLLITNKNNKDGSKTYSHDDYCVLYPGKLITHSCAFEIIYWTVQGTCEATGTFVTEVNVDRKRTCLSQETVSTQRTLL